MAKEIDFFTSFLPHPDTGQLMFKTDERVINQRIRNLLMTGRGERPFEGTQGGSLRTLLFELFDSTTEDLAADYVKEVLKQEPSAQINNVAVKVNEAAGMMFIAIEYVHDGNPNPVQLTVTLSRVR